MTPEQAQAYLLANAQSAADSVTVGPFVVGFDTGSDNPFLNYAVPELGADPSPAEVDALVAVFSERSRMPRLEYSPDATPGVLGPLTRAGFVPERTVSLMTSDSVAEPELAAGYELYSPTSDQDLVAVARMQNVAYGSAIPEDTAAQRMTAMVARGGVVVAVRESASGSIVSAGICTSPKNGVTELAAVATDAAHRSRGLASVVTARLSQLAPGEVFLTPEGPQEQAMYQRLGYRVCGQLLHISLPT